MDDDDDGWVAKGETREAAIDEIEKVSHANENELVLSIWQPGQVGPKVERGCI